MRGKDDESEKKSICAAVLSSMKRYRRQASVNSDLGRGLIDVFIPLFPKKKGRRGKRKKQKSRTSHNLSCRLHYLSFLMLEEREKGRFSRRLPPLPISSPLEKGRRGGFTGYPAGRFFSWERGEKGGVEGGGIESRFRERVELALSGKKERGKGRKSADRRSVVRVRGLLLRAARKEKGKEGEGREH